MVVVASNLGNEAPLPRNEEPPEKTNALVERVEERCALGGRHGRMARCHGRMEPSLGPQAIDERRELGWSYLRRHCTHRTAATRARAVLHVVQGFTHTAREGMGPKH